MVVTGSVTDLVLDQATRTPDAYAVLTPDGDPLTYAELVATSARLAGRLQAAGAGPERVVGIALPTGPAALVAILATLRAGAAYLPLDPGHPEARLAGLLADADPCVLVVAPGAACPVPGFTGPVLAADDSEGPLLEERPIHPHALAYLIYTSGSSGAPKGVQVSHAALTNLAVGFRDRHGFGPGQRLLMLPPLTFDASVGDVFPAWVSGATLIPDPDPVTLGAAELCALVDRLGVTAIDTAAAQWQQWVRELSGRPAPPELASLRLVMIGGEAVRPDAVAAWGRLTGGRIRLVNHYGPTEATVCATTYETVDGTELGGAALPLGSPLPGVSVTVMDEQLRPVPVGVPGELCLGGVGLARGYAGRPDLTAAAFVPGPAGQRLYRTGDRVVRRRDGRLDFLGRTDRQVKIRGHRIELGEVESALVSHKAVREAAVLARTGPDGMAGLVAYVVPAGPAGVDRAGGGRDLPESLRSWCAQRLPEYLRPGSYVVLDRLPTTEHGKTDLAALPVPAQSAGPSGRPPRAGTESRLAALWSELLAAPAVGADDDFFDLGGHSLLIPTVTSRVRAEFGVPLPARALFDTPRLADLAAAIERLRQGDRLDDDADLTATLLRDAVLPPDVGAGLDAALTHPPNGAVLLTGGSGFLGGVLLAELLDRTPLRVRCLVRAEFPAAGLARLRDNLTALGVWRAEYADRIDVLCGDLDEPALGLGADAVPPLNAEVDAIYHVGGRTQAGAPYHFLAPANVGGTIELLRLAGHRYAVPVHYVSTLGVYLGGGFAGQTVTEADPPPATPDGLVTGYAQSKWVADALVRAARGRGLPVTVYRPARIGGHSRTGRWTAHEAFARIVTSFVQLGAAYLEDPDYDLAPVDHVAAAICWLSRQPAAAGQDFHFHNPARLSADDLLATLREAGYAVAAVGFEEYVERIERMQAKGGEVAVTPLRGLAQEETTTEAARFDCTRTEQATAVAGLVCPPADRALLHRYLADFVRTGVLPAPGSAA